MRRRDRIGRFHFRNKKLYLKRIEDILLKEAETKEIFHEMPEVRFRQP
jgi:hypothetical protein